MLPSSAACERNKDPILEVLRLRFADRTQVLEIGSGTGQHAVYFARQLGHLAWHPTEQLAYLADLTERVKLEGPGNLRAPSLLDVRQAVWPVRGVDAMFTANTLHIMSWPEVMALFNGIGTVQERDPQSGLRDIEAVSLLADQYGLRLDADFDLPANNRLLVFTKEPG
jgi:cyclopropane fatty-acyl-phospholipid synthase-like methyltransferase